MLTLVRDSSLRRKILLTLHTIMIYPIPNLKIPQHAVISVCLV
jgi:hypothetical protein